MTIGENVRQIVRSVLLHEIPYLRNLQPFILFLPSLGFSKSNHIVIGTYWVFIVWMLIPVEIHC